MSDPPHTLAAHLSRRAPRGPPAVTFRAQPGASCAGSRVHSHQAAKTGGAYEPAPADPDHTQAAFGLAAIQGGLRQARTPWRRPRGCRLSGFGRCCTGLRGACFAVAGRVCMASPPTKWRWVRRGDAQLSQRSARALFEKVPVSREPRIGFLRCFGLGGPWARLGGNAACLPLFHLLHQDASSNWGHPRRLWPTKICLDSTATPRKSLHHPSDHPGAPKLRAISSTASGVEANRSATSIFRRPSLPSSERARCHIQSQASQLRAALRGWDRHLVPSSVLDGVAAADRHRGTAQREQRVPPATSCRPAA